MKLSRLALAIALASPAAFAANDTPRFDDQLKLPAVVVTASRTAESKGDSHSAVTVYTRDDIERLQPSTVADLLRRTPGVQIKQDGGRGSTTGVFIRGTKTAQTLVLIDGQRVNSPDGGNAPLSLLSVDQIERIEVLRGPRSALYGSDAIGGVVQIFTRRAEDQGLKPRVRVAYGSHDTWEQSAGLSGGNANTRFNLSLSHEQSNGFSRADTSTGPDADADGFENTAVALNLNHRFNEHTEAGFNFNQAEGDSEYDAFGWGVHPYEKFNHRFSSAYLDSRVASNWNTRLEVGYSDSEVRHLDKLAPGNASHSNIERESLAWINQVEVGPRHRLILGADWYRDHVKTSGEYAEDSRYNAAAFIQYAFSGERLGGELGVRHDDNEMFSSENTWNAALKLPVHDGHALSLSYGEGFRAPTFTDLYYPFASNPNLEAETSKTYELRWLAEVGDAVEFEAALYRSDLNNAIVWDNAVYMPRNVQEARLSGLELSLKTEVLGWHSQVSASLLKPEDRTSGNDLQYRARRTISWDVDRQFGVFTAGATWNAVGRAYDDAANTRVVPGYGIVGLRASWRATPELEVALKADNLFDKSYYNAIGYQEDGRSAQLAFTWTPSL